MRFLNLLIIIALLLSLSVAVFAHPGRTDSSGGHIDQSTGEYHYHHGYSAHQHSDLDGDGDLDCPYKFVDRTDSLGESSAQKTTSYEETKTFHDYVWDVFLLVLCWLSFVVVCRLIGWLYRKFFKR